MSTVNVYTDGSCLNNGQPHIAQGGIGVYWGPNNIDNVSEPMKGPPSSNGAELQAAARAIRIAKQRGKPALCIVTDSEVVCTAGELYKQRSNSNWRRYDEYKQQSMKIGDRNNFELLENAMNDYKNVEFKHVRGHSGNQHNMEANRLAREGAKLYRPGYY